MKKVAKFIIPLFIITAISLFILSSGIGNQLYTNISNNDNVQITVHKHQHKYVDLTFILHGILEGKGIWTPNSIYNENGISYTYTTRNLVTNVGLDLMQDHILDQGDATTDRASWIALSSDSAAPAYTDTTLAGEITTGGLARAQGTYTPGTPSAGSVTAEQEKQFDSTATHNNVQKAGLFTLSAAGIMYAENTFSSVNLISGDSLTITWQFTYSDA